MSTTRVNFTRITLVSLAATVALAAALWFGGRAHLAGSVVPAEGRHQLSDLDAPVEVLFDGRGIPQIYAETDADALRALGWLHAGERLFQMELIRRVARGEIAALIGPVGLESDFRHRSLGFARRIREDPPALAPKTRMLVEAYVHGINRRIERGPAPPEFLLMQETPEPWSVDDVLTVAYYQSWYATTLVQRLAESRREIREAFGEPAGAWLSDLPEWTRSTIPPTAISEASNTWVVAPERSASGHALHAADPHLDYTTAPGMWYAAGLHSPESLDVVGVTAPGLPFVAMGHNGRIAWAFTVAPVDVTELYRQERHPDDPALVRGPGGWQPLLRRQVVLEVHGGETVTRELLSTPLGIVLEADDDAILTLRWAGFELDPAELVEGGLAINRATDFPQFRTVASDMGPLSVNWSYSDAQGNIGYVQSTPVPRRNHENFFAVLDASDPVNDWDGFHPPVTRPHAINPDQGWLANSNNHAAGDDWPYPIPGFYKHLRMRRASAWLERPGPFDTATMRAMQLDRTSDRALAWKDWLADVAAGSGRDTLARELRDWDGVMAADSGTAGLFARWWGHLPRHLFALPEGPDWRTMHAVLDEWLHQPPDDETMPHPDRDAAALAALEDALQQGARPLGSIQQLEIRHALAGMTLLNRWLRLSRGPVPVGGDAGSLNVTYAGFDPESGRLTPRAGASMRFVLDWADPDAFSLNLTLGQSGHPLSPHFDDFLPAFLDGTPWTVPFTRPAVEARTGTRLVLEP